MKSTHLSRALWVDSWLMDSCYKSIHHQRLLNLLHTTHSDDACVSRASWLEDITFGWTSLELLYSQVGGLALVPFVTTAPCNNSSTCYVQWSWSICFLFLRFIKVMYSWRMAVLAQNCSLWARRGRRGCRVTSDSFDLFSDHTASGSKYSMSHITICFDYLKMMHSSRKFKFAWFWSKLLHAMALHTELPQSFSSVSFFI